MSLNKVYEFGRSDGLLKTVIIKEKETVKEKIKQFRDKEEKLWH